MRSRYAEVRLIVKVDMNAAELRVAALLARDAPWLEAFTRGESPHDANALALFGHACAKDSAERTFAKAYVFRWLYTHPDKAPSLDPGQLRVAGLAINLPMLALYSERLNQAHEAIVRAKRRYLSELHTTRLTRNAWGRYRDLSWALQAHADDLVVHAENVALNFPIQSAIGEVMDDSVLLVDEALRHAHIRAHIIAQRHDELLFEATDADVPALVLTVRKCMERPIPELDGAVLPVEFEAGPSWGETRPYKVTLS